MMSYSLYKTGRRQLISFVARREKTKIMDVTLLWIALIYLLDGVSTAQRNLTEVQVGDSITLFTDENRTDEKLAYIKWTVNHKKIITYIAEGGERRAKAYADRIELDHYTGDLKLKNLQQSDSGDYRVVHIRSAKEFARMKKDIVKKLLTMDIRDYAYNIRITDNVANGTEINVNLHGDFDDDNPLLALF